MSQDPPENNPEEVSTENTDSQGSKTFHKILFDLSNSRRELAIEQDRFFHSRIAHWFTLVTGICTALYLNSSFNIKCSDEFGLGYWYNISLMVSWLSAIIASFYLFKSELIRNIKQSALMREWIDWVKKNESFPDYDKKFIEDCSKEAASDEEEWENLYEKRMTWLNRAQYFTAASLISLLLTILFKAIIENQFLHLLFKN